ncbi:MAG: hypothetical protein CML44_04810 [Rhodobacteraceae bacterium]|nr:hypothetical protein [Paracoccaceae bacterium]|tara:strand:+ start:1807 stop:2019 length:213 start_codon:yes stop_codon:yes gene_type:complete
MNFAIVNVGKSHVLNGRSVYDVYMYLKDPKSSVTAYVGFDINEVRQHTYKAMDKNDMVEEFTMEEWNDVQ